MAEGRPGGAGVLRGHRRALSRLRSPCSGSAARSSGPSPRNLTFLRASGRPNVVGWRVLRNWKLAGSSSRSGCSQAGLIPKPSLSRGLVRAPRRSLPCRPSEQARGGCEDRSRFQAGLVRAGPAGFAHAWVRRRGDCDLAQSEKSLSPWEARHTGSVEAGMIETRMVSFSLGSFCFFDSRYTCLSLG